MTSQMYGKSLLVAFFAFSSLTAFAQDERLLADADAVLNSEQITIDGTFKTRVVEKSPEEILTDARRASEIRQIKKIAKRIEKMALPEKQVRKITKKESSRLSSRINTIFNDGEDVQQEDKVEVKQAAPVAAAPIMTPIVIARPEIEKKDQIKPFSQIKLIPFYGFQNILGEQIDFASKFNAGIAVESMLSNRISAGIGFSYSTLDFTDVAEGHFGEKFDYKHFSVEANTKLFLAPDSIVRPYIGVGLSYNRTNLKFTDSLTYNSNYDEEYNSSYIAGHARVGAEVCFAKNVGFNLEFAYSRGLFKGSEYTSYQESEEQQRLDSLGNVIENADFLSVNAGMVVTF